MTDIAATSACWRHLVLVPCAAALLALGGCATPPPPRDYSAFAKAKPASILVLPPTNDSPDVLATPSVLAQLTLPLAEAGYYVLPVSLVDETLKVNGVQTAVDSHQIAPARLREIFGADAVLYVAVKRYGSVYRVVSSDTVVVLEARLVDLRSGEQLWNGTASASSAEQGGGNQGGLIGLLVKAVIDQIASNLSERSHPIAGIASNRLLLVNRAGGILAGPRALGTPR
jgi:hypothetical protein